MAGLPFLPAPRFFLLAALALLAGCGRHRSGSRPPDVILLSVDTLRADHLSCYGYGRDTSPWLDGIAAAGCRFARVFAQAPRTAPSHMTIMTSTYPSVHGVRKDNASSRFALLPAGIPTLARLFREGGYRTAALTGGGQVTRGFGFERGFELFRETLYRLEWKGFEPLFEWLDTVSPEEPCFLFIHTYEVHAPYCPPPPFDRRYFPRYEGWISAAPENQDRVYRVFARRKPSPYELRRLQALYDGEIRYTDGLFRRFFEELRKRGRFGTEHTLFVFTSDHGEEFMEHGGLQHSKLYREIMHVPLLFFQPGRLPAGKVVNEAVRTLDIAPTLLDLAGLDVPESMMGLSLKPLLFGRPLPPLPAYSESFFRPGEYALREGGAVLYRREDGRLELYDTGADPREKKDLLAVRPVDPAAETRAAALEERARGLRAGLEAFLRARRLPGARDARFIDPVEQGGNRALREQLRALGYVR